MTTTEVADFFDVHPKTVRGWITSGRLPALRTPSRSGRGRLRVRRAAVEGFLDEVAVSTEVAALVPSIAPGGAPAQADPAWQKETFLP